MLDLKDRGRTDREIWELTGVPINTIRAWRNHGLPGARRDRGEPERRCHVCGGDPHDLIVRSQNAYSYLLGVYLGDGCLTRNGRSWLLRVTLDMSYPGIVGECCDAIEEIRGENRPWATPHSSGNKCVVIYSTWHRWRCYFPQHGPGRKHKRRIELDGWQREIVNREPHAFLRGLIHTDGWRGVNRVHVKGRDYVYPRYQFSNRSDDIRKLFTDTCDQLGIEWRRWTRYHISVARRESVAFLDSFVGRKY